MDVKIKTNTSIEDILTKYDADDLLRTVPYDYRVEPSALKSYAKKISPTVQITVVLTEQINNWLNALAENNNVPMALVFNYLIEIEADCGKVHTKNIKHALNYYYYALNNDKELFSRILEGYSNSPYYNEKTGLSEEGVAYFLTMSKERTRNNK